MKAQYDHQPAKLEAVGNGSFLWRWNIQPTEKTDPQTEEVTIGWECDEVVIWNEPTTAKIKKAVINETWGTNVEAKLINDYNAVNEGLLPAEKKQAYLDFISERMRLKEDIQNYFEIVP